MSGFCPDDWHGTTEADLQQMAMGEDYEYWSDFVVPTRRSTPSPRPISSYRAFVNATGNPHFLQEAEFEAVRAHLETLHAD